MKAGPKKQKYKTAAMQLFTLCANRDAVKVPKSLASDKKYHKFYCFHCQIGFSNDKELISHEIQHQKHMEENKCITKCKMVMLTSKKYEVGSGTSPVFCFPCNKPIESWQTHKGDSGHKNSILQLLKKV